MWHDGASQAEMLERIMRRRSAAAGLRWPEEIPRILRPLYRHGARMILRAITGPEHCGPDHKVVICDAHQV
jgi:hypothetical protein